MKIGIHYTKANWSFCHQWIEYCQANNIPHKLVNTYSNNIVEELTDCDIFMCHHHHSSYKEKLFAKQLLFSLQQAGIKVFPDFNTGWHFDDKVGQKYLLEAINAPLAPSYVFYTKKEALEWVKKTSFPKVFKLRGGAGSSNVKLANSKKEAIKFINKAFGKGFPQYSAIDNLKERYNKYKHGHTTISNVLKGIIRLGYPTEFSKMYAPEKGYAYFQDFIPNNNYDIRLIIIGGEKAYGMKRLVRQNDFRASGSNSFIYDKIDEQILKIGFETANKLNLQAVAFDFVYDINKSPLIIEMSYAYGTKGSRQCNGYWSDNLVWHEGSFNPFGWIIDNLIVTRNKIRQ